MAQRQPTRPAGGRMPATSIKATRNLMGIEKLPRIASPRDTPGDQLMAKPPPEADDGDDEAQRVQGYDLQYCESMLVAIEKESTQNSQRYMLNYRHFHLNATRYLNMLEFKEGKDPKLESMRAGFKSLTDELHELEVLCASGWDTDDIDEALRRLPRDVVAAEAHRWASSS